MKHFSTWSQSTDPHFSERRVVAFDLDDTLTHKGELPASVHRALETVREKGWTTVLVTGRSAGWVDAIIKLLPFDAVVGENGALLSFWPRKKLSRGPREEPKKLFWNPAGYLQAPPSNIRANFEKASIEILKAFPRTRVASDQPYRIYDLAIDFAEEVDPPLGLDVAERIQKKFTELGATAKVSSIHVNGWWGSFTKEQGLRELLEKHYNLSLKTNLIYSGDSPNDGPLFAVAGLSVGVANIRLFESKSEFHWPEFVTKGESAAGALEILESLGSKR